MDDSSNFLSTLFDFSFKEFITIRIIKIIYGVGILLAGIATITFLVSGFANLFLRLILSPVVFIIYTILLRVWLEVVIVLFNISENVEVIAKAKK